MLFHGNVKLILFVDNIFIFTGQQAEFIVNTCGAGAGTLAITVDGPAQVKMNVAEVAEGYKCMYTAPLPGAYLINIRYAGQQHISGSPFRANITGKQA